jgi:hypothetical protein
MTKFKHEIDDSGGRTTRSNAPSLNDSSDVDPWFWALRDLERKRAEIDAAVNVILKLRPHLRRPEATQG